MALTDAQRVQIARNNTDPFANRVIAALVVHSKFLALHFPGATDTEKALARNVANNPDGYVWRFSVAILMEPAFDGITGTDQIPFRGERNENNELVGLPGLVDTVQLLWPLFAPLPPVEA